MEKIKEEIILKNNFVTIKKEIYKDIWKEERKYKTTYCNKCNSSISKTNTLETEGYCYGCKKWIPII